MSRRQGRPRSPDPVAGPSNPVPGTSGVRGPVARGRRAPSPNSSSSFSSSSSSPRVSPRGTGRVAGTPASAASRRRSRRFRYACPDCDRFFRSVRGVGLHRRAAHEELLNAEIDVDRARRQWSQEELRMLARLEARALAAGVAAINMHLHQHMPGRSFEAVKGVRRRADYKAMVVAASAEVDSPSSAESTYYSPSEDHSPRQSLASSRVSGERGRPVVEAVSDAVRSLLDVVSAIRGWSSDLLVGLAERALRGEDVRAAIVEWLRTVFPLAPQRLVPRPPPRAGVEHRSRRSRRRAEYARVQTLFRKDMSRAAAVVLDGDAVPTVFPDLDRMSAHWSAFVGRPSVPVVAPGVEPRVALEGVWCPVTHDELRAALVPGGSAPGPDGVTPAQWRNVPLSVRVLFYNVVMLSGGFPREVLVSRTVFIPKVQGSQDPSDYRPISVSSVVVRQFHKVLASRLLGSQLVDLRQRCFDDGCAENVAVLATVIHEARGRLRELHVASVDMAKAYDSVSHSAIRYALVSAGLPLAFVQYVESLYGESCTVFEVAGVRSPRFPVTRGIRQGDPLSPVLFCMVVDHVLRGVSSDIGFEVGGERITSLAFADDILLFASSRLGLQSAIRAVEDTAARFGLLLNAGKSSVLSIVPDGARKRFKILTEPTFYAADGSAIPQLSTTSEWKYLGVNFRPRGPQSGSFDLQPFLVRLSRAPLKPQQRLKILRCFLLPRVYHGLVLGRVTAGRLRLLDRQVRKAVRRWLRLPDDTAIGFFHASIVDGGLGIPSLSTSIPGLMFSRYSRFPDSSSAAVRACAEAPWVVKRLQWARKQLVSGDEVLSSKVRRSKWWARRLHQSVDGQELRECPRATVSTGWVDYGALAIPGRDYIQHVHTRINCLPSRVRTSRGVGRRDGGVRCRAGCQVDETAAHIVQVCHRTHGGRVKRHNAVCNIVAGGLRDAGWVVEQEQAFRTSVGLRKPDIVAVRGGRAVVVDAQVVSGGPPLDEAHNRKVAYYRDNEDLVARILERRGVERVRFTSCTISWRGVWSARSVSVLQELGLSKGLLRGITTRVLQGSHTNWTRFNQLTSRLPRTGIG